MGDADRERWDVRHAAAGELEPQPPEALRGHLELVPGAGRALDVACGRGAVAVWLAARGLDVDAVDVSEAGLAAGAELAARHGTEARWWRHDLDGGLPAPVTGPYDLVVCQRFRDPALYPALVDRLTPGGLLAVTVLSEVGGPAGPFRAPPGELRGAFAGLDVLVDVERDGVAHLVGRARLR